VGPRGHQRSARGLWQGVGRGRGLWRRPCWSVSVRVPWAWPGYTYVPVVLEALEAL